MDFALLHMTLPEIVSAIGYFGVFLIVFVESGIPIGIIIPLPGDTLLFAAGILAGTGTFSLVPLMLVVFIGALLGNSAGYWFGAKFGPALFNKPDAWFLSPRTLKRAEDFFARYGKRALIFARFIPVLRTVVPIGAGVARMPYKPFMQYNAGGAFVWTVLVTLAGYYLGSVIPNVDQYLLPILGVIIILSSGSIIREVLKNRQDQKRS